MNIQASSNQIKQPDRPKLADIVGPGLITGASDDDPSGIASYSQAGAQFGYSLGWTLLLTHPLMCAIQMISALLHTFPDTLSPPADEEASKHKALEAAGHAKLVPNEELESLNAKMHVSRGGQLTPYGDPHGVLAETKAGLDQVVRERAYLLWEQAGRPSGRADDFWHQAVSALL